MKSVMQAYLEQSGRTASNEGKYGVPANLFGGLFGLVASAHNADLLKRCIFYRSNQETLDKRDKENKARVAFLISTLLENKNDNMFDEDKINILHTALGLMSEAGEILEELIESIIENRPIDKPNMVEEHGDILWYTALGLRASDSSFEESAIKNINKLRVRYPEKFNSENALNRDLQAEKVALTK